jgi:hypothetical protein
MPVTDFVVVDVPAELRFVPSQKVEAALGVGWRTLRKRLAELGIPITEITHNRRGLIVPDLERLILHSRLAVSAAAAGKHFKENHNV